MDEVGRAMKRGAEEERSASSSRSPQLVKRQRFANETEQVRGSWRAAGAAGNNAASAGR